MLSSYLLNTILSKCWFYINIQHCNALMSFLFKFHKQINWFTILGKIPKHRLKIQISR